MHKETLQLTHRNNKPALSNYNWSQRNKNLNFLCLFSLYKNNKLIFLGTGNSVIKIIKASQILIRYPLMQDSHVPTDFSEYVYIC